MAEVVSDRPVPKALLKALQYDNRPFVNAAAQELRLSEESALELFYELKLYFYLCFHYDERLPAPIHIDAIWHVFLDHKEAYEAFCLECFGGIIEHIPHATPPETGVNKTIDRAHDKFGPRLANRWQGATRCDGMYRPAA